MRWRRLWLTTALAALLVAVVVAESEELATRAPQDDPGDVVLLARQLANEVSEAVAEAARQKIPLKKENEGYGDPDKKSPSEAAHHNDNDRSPNTEEHKPLIHLNLVAENHSPAKQSSCASTGTGTTVCLNEKDAKSFCLHHPTTPAEAMRKDATAGQSVHKPSKCPTHAAEPTTHKTTKCTTHTTCKTTTPCAKGTRYVAHVFIASSPFTKCHKATTPSHAGDGGDAGDDDEGDGKPHAKSVRSQGDGGVAVNVGRRLSLLLEREAQARKRDVEERGSTIEPESPSESKKIHVTQASTEK